MKYVQINTVMSSTSIGRIMRRNYDMRKQEGWDCLIAYGRGEAVNGYNSVRIGGAADITFHGLQTRLFDQHGYGSKKATVRFLKMLDQYNPDIIHLHNLHGYYINFELLFRWIKAHPGCKVWWTLHDCWAMTGHCAYFTAAKCEQWKTQCRKCPQRKRYPTCYFIDHVKRNYMRKKRAFTGVSDMKLIVPSRWLAGIVKESFLKEYPLEVEYNRIDTDIFKPTPSGFREKYGLENQTMILGVANVWEQRKGLDDFMLLARMLDHSYAMVLVGLTQKQIKRIPGKIKGMIRTDRKEEGAVIFTAEDFSLNSGTEEAVEMTEWEGCPCKTSAVVPQGVENLYRAITGRVFEEKENKKTGILKLICISQINSREELSKIYTAADLFVNPTYEDNFPTVNLEALACGTKVIVYDVGGCRETISSCMNIESMKEK